jgi:extradiol dioxygenase family protein
MDQVTDPTISFSAAVTSQKTIFFFPFGENKIEKEKKMLYPQV